MMPTVIDTPQPLARIGAIAAFAGALVLLVSTLLHPLSADPNDPPAAFAEYAADRLWVWSHLGQFIGFAVLLVALVALAATLEAGGAAAWGRIGVAGATATIAAAAALQAVDGVALKATVDRWAAAPADARALAFEAALAVRQIEIGLASLLSLSAGLTLSVFGLAIFRSSHYPAWFAGVGLFGGLGTITAGAAQAATGFSGVAMTISMLASLVLLLWACLAGALLWRLAARLADDKVATRSR